MRTVIGLLLIAGGIALGYSGYNKLQDNKAEIKIGDLEISAKDSSNATQAYFLMGGGAVALLAGAILLAKKGK